MADTDLILGGGQFLVEGDRSGPKFVLSVLQPASESPSLVPTGFLPHAIAVHPQEPTRMAVFEKKGPGACVLDLNEMKVERTLATEPGRHFYGHGSFSSDGSLLFCTEAYLEGHSGVIAVRDGKTFQLLGEFPSYGEEPHECQLIDDGKVMVVTNGGGRLGKSNPCVTYIDVENQRLLHKLEPSREEINTGHFSIAENGALIVVSAPRVGLEQTHTGGVSISVKGADGPLMTMETPEEVVRRMKGEALSVAIHEPTATAAVTHPDGDMVTFWSLEKASFLKMTQLPRPRGITLNRTGEAFYISYGENTALARVECRTLETDVESLKENTYLSGSHLFNWLREIDALGFEMESQDC